MISRYVDWPAGRLVRRSALAGAGAAAAGTVHRAVHRLGTVRAARAVGAVEDARRARLANVRAALAIAGAGCLARTARARAVLTVARQLTVARGTGKSGDDESREEGDEDHAHDPFVSHVLARGVGITGSFERRHERAACSLPSTKNNEDTTFRADAFGILADDVIYGSTRSRTKLPSSFHPLSSRWSTRNQSSAT